jgi:hypothetical protein
MERLPMKMSASVRGMIVGSMALDAAAGRTDMVVDRSVGVLVGERGVPRPVLSPMRCIVALLICSLVLTIAATIEQSLFSAQVPFSRRHSV